MSDVPARRVEIQDKRTVFDDFFRIDEATLRYERFDGRMSPTLRRLSFERGDSAAALLLNVDTQRVLLVDQFKYPTYEKGPGWLPEVVAGVIEPGEGPADAIRREILEEAGYRADDVVHIATFYVSPGGSSERIVLFYAEVTSADRVAVGGGVAAEGEDIALLDWSLDELWAALDAGRILDAKTLIAAQWLRRRLEVER